MRPDRIPEVYVSVGDGCVVIRRSGRSVVTVAQILGADLDAAGQPRVLYLDRLVHTPYEAAFVGWTVRGAVSSILERESLGNPESGGSAA